MLSCVRKHRLGCKCCEKIIKQDEMPELPRFLIAHLAYKGGRESSSFGRNCWFDAALLPRDLPPTPHIKLATISPWSDDQHFHSVNWCCSGIDWHLWLSISKIYLGCTSHLNHPQFVGRASVINTIFFESLLWDASVTNIQAFAATVCHILSKDVQRTTRFWHSLLQNTTSLVHWLKPLACMLTLKALMWQRWQGIRHIIRKSKFQFSSPFSDLKSATFVNVKQGEIK